MKIKMNKAQKGSLQNRNLKLKIKNIVQKQLNLKKKRKTRKKES